MRVLLVEDDKLFGAAAHRALVRTGYATDWVASVQEFLAAVRVTHYDAVLLDLGLPDGSGDECLQFLRSRPTAVSILAVTARGGVADRIRLLGQGADDYLVKPIDLDEMVARLRAVTRRALQAQTASSALVHGAIELHPERRAATWHGKPVALTNKEFWLLETLLRKKNEVLSRQRLEEALYSWGDEVDSNAIEVYVHYLRRKFCSALIRTVRGVGYQLGPENLDARAH